MNQPKITEYDGWRSSAIGIWFFEHYLQGYADEAANINGRAVGTYPTKDEDHMTYVRNAGHINGVEYTINNDPFEEERNESEVNREISADQS